MLHSPQMQEDPQVSPDDAVRVFVYGTLRTPPPENPPEINSDNFLGFHTVRGWLYDAGPFPVLVEDPEGVPVVGELWEVPSRELQRLDRYEGTAQGLYTRVVMECSGPSASPAYVYVKGPRFPFTNLTLIPRGDWYER